MGSSWVSYDTSAWVSIRRQLLNLTNDTFSSKEDLTDRKRKRRRNATCQIAGRRPNVASIIAFVCLPRSVPLVPPVPWNSPNPKWDIIINGTILSFSSSPLDETSLESNWLLTPSSSEAPTSPQLALCRKGKEHAYFHFFLHHRNVLLTPNLSLFITPRGMRGMRQRNRRRRGKEREREKVLWLPPPSSSLTVSCLPHLHFGQLFTVPW